MAARRSVAIVIAVVLLTLVAQGARVRALAAELHGRLTIAAAQRDERARPALRPDRGRGPSIDPGSISNRLLLYRGELNGVPPTELGTDSDAPIERLEHPIEAPARGLIRTLAALPRPPPASH